MIIVIIISLIFQHELNIYLYYRTLTYLQVEQAFNMLVIRSLHSLHCQPIINQNTSQKNLALLAFSKSMRVNVYLRNFKISFRSQCPQGHLGKNNRRHGKSIKSMPEDMHARIESIAYEDSWDLSINTREVVTPTEIIYKFLLNLWIFFTCLLANNTKIIFEGRLPKFGCFGESA